MSTVWPVGSNQASHKPLLTASSTLTWFSGCLEMELRDKSVERHMNISLCMAKTIVQRKSGEVLSAMYLPNPLKIK